MPKIRKYECFHCWSLLDPEDWDRNQITSSVVVISFYCKYCNTVGLEDIGKRSLCDFIKSLKN